MRTAILESENIHVASKYRAFVILLGFRLFQHQTSGVWVICSQLHSKHLKTMPSPSNTIASTD